MFNDCLIMAGGSGTRLWPASNSALPKQFLPAKNKMSFFSLALERALAAGERVIIITGKAHIPHVITDCAKLSSADRKRLVVIGEPAAKNTAPAVACAVIFSVINQKAEDNDMLVLTSDHIISPLKKFESAAGLAKKAAADNKLVVFGIPPARPETGYGYIETARTDRRAPVIKNAKNSLLDVMAFHEKPDFKNAEKYIKNGHFFWNSGMFAFKTGFMADQYNSLAPDVIKPFYNLEKPRKSGYSVLKGVRVLDNWNNLESAYKKTRNISFDYAVAEKCDKAVMVRANFNWIDVGSWDEYIKLHEKTSPDVFSFGSNDCYIDSDIPVALAGVTDLIVIIRGGKNGRPASALITKKGHSQKVRGVVEIIKKAGKKDML